MEKKTFFQAVVIPAVVLLAVSVTPVYASGGKQVTVPKTFGSSQIQDFQVLDRETVIFEVAGMGNLVAEIFPGCHGLRFATTLAIRDRAFQLSRGSTLLLPDGERCSVLSVTKLEDQES